MFELWTLDSTSPLFYVSIVFISLTPAIPTVFILAYISTRSIVHAIPLIVTWRSAVVIDLKICEYKSHYPDVAQTSFVFLVPSYSPWACPDVPFPSYCPGASNSYLNCKNTPHRFISLKFDANKILVTNIKENLLTRLSQFPLLTTRQHSFLTITHLLSAEQIVIIDVFCLDYAKAF